VGRLYVGLIGLTFVFATSMAFATLAVDDLAWWPGAVAGGIMLLFLAGSGAVIPGPLRAFSGARRKTARAAVMMFSSLWGLCFFVMALITWILGKRALPVHTGSGNPYLTLGLLIFLGLVGVGISGFLSMAAYFVYVRNQSLVVPSRIEAKLEEARRREAILGHG
jgi:hypothetical protein